VDPDDPRTRGWSRAARSRTASAVGGAASPEAAAAEPGPAGAPPLPKRRIELRSTEDHRHRMCVRVPPHLGNAGDDAAVTMLALNPDRRIVVGVDGTTWQLWPVREEAAAVPKAVAGSHRVCAVPEGGRPRHFSLPEGFALGQLTDQEILDLLA
jgi:hypothetical protein